jgi:hypothetical protein
VLPRRELEQLVQERRVRCCWCGGDPCWRGRCGGRDWRHIEWRHVHTVSESLWLLHSERRRWCAVSRLWVGDLWRSDGVRVYRCECLELLAVTLLLGR